MKISRMTVLVACLAVAISGVMDTAVAKGKGKKSAAAQTETSSGAPSENANPNSTGFPNGRPWQALDMELDLIKYKLLVVDGKVDNVLVDTGDILDDTAAILLQLDEIQDDIGDLGTDLGSVADDVAVLKNTLDVQVRVMTIDPAVLNDQTDEEPVVVYVTVVQGGVGVADLTADDFTYTNSFPSGAAGFCGDACFSAGDGGQYALMLQGSWEVGSYAGTLAVEHTDGEATANGAAQVVFDIPAAPAP